MNTCEAAMDTLRPLSDTSKMARCEDNAQGKTEDSSLIVSSSEWNRDCDDSKSAKESDQNGSETQSEYDEEETQPLVDAMEKIESSSGEASPSNTSLAGEATSACEGSTDKSDLSPVVDSSESHPLIAENSPANDTTPRSCSLDPNPSCSPVTGDYAEDAGDTKFCTTVVVEANTLKSSSASVGGEQTDSGNESSADVILSQDSEQRLGAEAIPSHAQEQNEDCSGMTAAERLEWQEFLDQRLEEAHRSSSLKFIAMTPPKKARPGSPSEDWARAEGASGDEGSVYVFTPKGSKTKMSPFGRFKKNLKSWPKRTPGRSRRHLDLPPDLDAPRSVEDSFELKPLEVEQRPEDNKSWRLSGYLSVSMNEEGCCQSIQASFLSRLAACLSCCSSLPSLCGRLAACSCCRRSKNKTTADDVV